MAIPRRISIVTLGVRDLAASTAFYERLGWTASSASNDEITFVATADSVLGLYPFEKLAEDCELPAEDLPRFHGVTCAINVDTPDQVAEVLDDAVAAGATLLKASQKVFWGGTSGYFADPDGHAWEVAHNPYLEHDSRGSLTLPD